MSAITNPKQLTVGDTLPPRNLPVTTSQVISGALATRDFEPIHHDVSVAKAAGLPNVFMNILTSQGLLETCVTESLGYQVNVKKVDIRLGAPNLPGANLTFTAEVCAVDGNEIEFAVRCDNDQWGQHLKGTVRVVVNN